MDASVSTMTCSIIIPTRNRAEILTKTLDSLASQCERDFEAIVVCDGEDPETRALSEAYSANYPLHWIFTAENRGQASARNTGVSAAQGEILLFLDDDTVAAPDLIHQHRQQHEAQHMHNALVVYGRLVYLYPRECRSHTERLLRMDGEQSNDAVEADLTRLRLESIGLDYRCRVCGVNCSISRAAFLSCGGFDPALRYRGEDYEFGSRLYDWGAQFIFEPRALAYHHETKELAEHFRWTCEHEGRSEVYRAWRKSQRNPQTQGLVAVQHRNPLRRLKLRWYWDRPETIRGIAKMLRRVTDATGSKLAHQASLRAEMGAGYWQGVKSEGLTLMALRELVGEPLPVFMFRNISLPRDRREEKQALSPRRFLRLLQVVRKLKYHSVSPAEGLSPGVDRRRVVLTFDGYDDFYFEVFPHVNRLWLKPLVFLVADHLGGLSAWDEQTGYLPWKLLSVEQVREMHRHGIQFGSYGLAHGWLPGLPDADLRREVVESKARLEDLLGSEVTSFAYPGGGVDARVRAAVARAGYQFGFTTRVGLNFWEDRLALKRLTVSERDSTLDLILKLVTGRSIRDNACSDDWRAVCERACEFSPPRARRHWNKAVDAASDDLGE